MLNTKEHLNGSFKIAKGWSTGFVWGPLDSISSTAWSLEHNWEYDWSSVAGVALEHCLVCPQTKREQVREKERDGERSRLLPLQGRPPPPMAQSRLLAGRG